MSGICNVGDDDSLGMIIDYPFWLGINTSFVAITSVPRKIIQRVALQTMGMFVHVNIWGIRAITLQR